MLFICSSNAINAVLFHLKEKTIFYNVAELNKKRNTNAGNFRLYQYSVPAIIGLNSHYSIDNFTFPYASLYR